MARRRVEIGARFRRGIRRDGYPRATREPRMETRPKESTAACELTKTRRRPIVRQRSKNRLLWLTYGHAVFNSWIV